MNGIAKHVLISGASIAGPALAYWLTRYGYRVTVVEKAPALRPGGFNVDFRGHVHLAVLERMGVLDEIRAQQTNMGDMVLVDEQNRPQAALPSSFMAGDVEIERGKLSRILYDRTKDSAEYVFGDSIASLTETADGVHVTFDNGEPRTFDLVVGADGLHSNVRRLAFGDEAEYVHHLGYYVAGGYSVPNRLGLEREGRVFSVPGRSAMLTSVERESAGAGFIFAADQLTYDRHDIEQQKRIVAERYAGIGWEVPGLLTAMWESPDFYFDAISQVRMDSWSSGRVVLLGDAGYGATMGGLGTGLAVVCSYVLAGELARADGDHRAAFARYEQAIRKYARGCQKLAEGAGPFLAPQTKAQIRQRNIGYRMLSSRLMAGVFNRMTTKAASAITLENYAA